ncbi:MAG: hypothetical protein Q8P70_02535 [bacterium]|nr:hypothetical protein [bacterium]
MTRKKKRKTGKAILILLLLLGAVVVAYLVFESRMRDLRTNNVTNNAPEESIAEYDSSSVLEVLNGLQERTDRLPEYSISYRGSVWEQEERGEEYKDEVVMVVEKQHRVVRANTHPFIDQVARNAFYSSYVFLDEGVVVSCFGTDALCEEKRSMVEHLLTFSGNEVASALILLENGMVRGREEEPHSLASFDAHNVEARSCVPIFLEANGIMPGAKQILFSDISEGEIEFLKISLCLDEETGVLLDKRVEASLGNVQIVTTARFASFSRSSSGLYNPFVPEKVSSVFR